MHMELYSFQCFNNERGLTKVTQNDVTYHSKDRVYTIALKEHTLCKTLVCSLVIVKHHELADHQVMGF